MSVDDNQGALTLLDRALAPRALAATRAKLAAKRDACVLFDIAQFTRSLEAVYLGIARHWSCRG